MALWCTCIKIVHGGCRYQQCRDQVNVPGYKQCGHHVKIIPQKTYVLMVQRLSQCSLITGNTEVKIVHSRHRYQQPRDRVNVI